MLNDNDVAVMDLIGETFDTVVVGLGKTGFSCVKFLTEQGVKFAVTDSRATPPMLSEMRSNYPDVPLYLGGFAEHVLCCAKHLLVSPGVSLDEPAIVQAADSGAEVYGDIELFCRQTSTPVIAITGSNGKSTVTRLVGNVLQKAGIKVAVGGNLGVPALDLLEEATDVYVLELSSFQLESVSSLNAVVATVLNIAEDHLDRHSNLEVYASRKAKIYNGNGVVVINDDDPLVSQMRRDGRHCIAWTLQEPTEGVFGVRQYSGERFLVKGNEKLLPVSELKVKGEHNICNALAVLALSEAVDCPLAITLSVLQEFSGLPHRCQLLGEYNGVSWYNDSKATNVAATCAAIAGLGGENNIILIAGGDGKGASFEPLAETAREHLKAVIAMGRDRDLIAEPLNMMTNVHLVESMQSAVKVAHQLAVSGDVVLLSPACASLDMFRDYQERGDIFAAAVREQCVC